MIWGMENPLSRGPVAWPPGERPPLVPVTGSGTVFGSWGSVARSAMHVCNTRVRYAETDQGGVAYHANYLNWFEVGRTDMLRALGHPYAAMERDLDVLLTVTEAHLTYRRPALYDEVLRIETLVSEVRRVRLRIETRIVRGDDDELLCDGHAIAEPDQALQILVGAMDRHPAHGDVLAQVLAPLGEDDPERGGSHHRVLEEELVEVTHAVPKQAVGVGRLDLEELGHGGACLAGRRGRRVQSNAPGGRGRSLRRLRFRSCPFGRHDPRWPPTVPALVLVNGGGLG